MKMQSGRGVRTTGWLVVFGVAVSLTGAAAPAQANVRERIAAARERIASAIQGPPKAQPGYVPRVVLKQIVKQSKKLQREQLEQGKADDAGALQAKINAARS